MTYQTKILFLKRSLNVFFFFFLLSQTTQAKERIRTYQADPSSDIMQIKAIKLIFMHGRNNNNIGLTFQTEPIHRWGIGSGILFNKKMHKLFDKNYLMSLQLPLQFFFYTDKAKKKFLYLGIQYGWIFQAIGGFGYEWENGLGLRLGFGYRLWKIYTEDFLEKYADTAKNYPIPNFTLELGLSYNVVKLLWWMRDRKIK